MENGGMIMINEIMTMKEAAEYFGIVEGTIRAAIKRGKLIEGQDYRKAGKITLVTREAVERIWGKR